MTRHLTAVAASATLLAASLFLSPAAKGYESYHDPNLNDQGYCAACHPGFAGGRSDTLHALHTGGTDPVTTDCNLCHTGSGRDNPFTIWSVGANDDGKGCAGCHGRDYGETVQQDYRGFPITGKSKASGYGLRRHHLQSGVNVCVSCHNDTLEPYPENTAPLYYALPSVSLGGQPADPCSNEDTANDPDALGLDNDGDLLVDAADPDCGVAPVCGDGNLDAGEDCDDGNVVSGDCCSASCAFEASGSPCDDSLFCNVGETCDGAGTCGGGGPRDCGDGVACTTDSCDEAGDSCVNTPDNTACDDTLFCNGIEVCDVLLDCQPGTAVNCDDGVGCTDDQCDEAQDQCVSTPLDLNCDDSLFCNGAETCDPLLDCQPGTPPNCDDGVACTTDSCDESTDSCVFTPDNLFCDDGVFCNGAETCNPVSDCLSGTPPTCDDNEVCTDDSCDSGTDACLNVFDPTNAPSCAIPVCGNGFLEAGEQCDDGNVLPGDCCSPTCAFESAGSACDDGLFCTVGGTCDSGGTCLSNPRDCSDSVSCTLDSCDEAADACLHSPDDFLCDDGLFCNGPEICDSALGCLAGPTVGCDDGISCTIDTCDEASDTCVNTPDDGACDDGLFCNGTETCDVALDCQPGTALGCDDGVACTDDSCDESTDSCANTPNDAACDDGMFCNGVETCDALLDCQAGTAVDCTDGVNCTTDACDETADACSNVADDAACDDSIFCNGVETCDALLDCQAGVPPSCDDGEICTDDSCDPALDSCQNVFDSTNDPSCEAICTDGDGDGFSIEGGVCGTVDCDDSDPAVNPGATELCQDNLDNDCDALIDAADPSCGFDGGWSVRAGPLADAAYAGSTACASCHPDHAEAWLNTLHARVLIRPGDAQATGFPLPPYNPAGGVVVESWSDVSFVVGQKWKTRLVDRNGFLQGVQWNYLQGQWVSYNNGQIVPYDCGSCHTTGFDPSATFLDDAGQPVPGIMGSWVEYNVGCEGCHGPGAEHAAQPSRSNINRISFDWYDENGDSVPDPVDIRSSIVCANCHFRGDRDGVQADLRSREQFTDWLVSGHADSLEPTSINTYCAKCHSPGNADYFGAEHYFTYFEPSDATHVTCISCHDPHETSHPRWETLQFPAGGQQDPRMFPPAIARYRGSDGNAFTRDFDHSFSNNRPNELCQDCHRVSPGFRRHADASPPAEITLKPPSNQPFLFPHGEHIEQGYATCLDCHMHRSRRSINLEDVRSHTFLPNEWVADPSLRLWHFADTCGQCHSEAQDCTWCHTEFSATQDGS